jgi:hypothetical protein
VIEEMELIYRDIEPVIDYGGYSPKELFNTKLRYLKTKETPKLKGSALLSKFFEILGDTFILFVLISIDGFLLALLFLLYTKNFGKVSGIIKAHLLGSFNFRTLALMAGILLAAGFCMLQTVLHFLQTLEKFRAGLKYDGAFRYPSCVTRR